MKNRIAILLALLIPLMALNAQTIDEPEISSIQNTVIEFKNYEGPHTVNESAEAIRGIGTDLGRIIANGATRSSSNNKYYVIHAVDSAVTTGLDADIIGLGDSAQVDHIKNLRRIVAGFLQTAYGYSQKDADTLSIFITIYNAVYRGNMEYFGNKYKEVVTRELTENKVGLSTNWEDWAGKSLIVIPLTSRAGMGVTGSIDSTPISDDTVIDSLKEESPTGGVEERQDIVDIKERDIEEERDAIEEEKKRIEEEEKKIEEQKTQQIEETTDDNNDQTTEQEPESTSDDTETTESDESTDETTEPKKNVETEETTEPTTDTEETETQPTKNTTEKTQTTENTTEETQLEKDKKALEEREKALQDKENEVTKDREDIATDQKETIRGEISTPTNTEVSGVVLFQLMNPDSPLSRLVLYNLDDGSTIRKSTLNTIKASTAIDMGDSFVVVAGQDTGTGGTVRLVKINKSNYDDIVTGSQDVFADTMIWKFGSSLYAVAKDGANWVIGRFDSSTLEMKAKSVPVTRFTFLTNNNGKLVAQAPDGSFVVLNVDTLAKE